MRAIMPQISGNTMLLPRMTLLDVASQDRLCFDREADRGKDSLLRAILPVCFDDCLALHQQGRKSE
jgi:hypothetical protein